MTESTTIAVFEDGDGILLFGPDSALAVFDGEPSVRTRTLSTRALDRAGKLLSGVSEVQATSGRWLKTTEESAALLRKYGTSRAKADELITGVVRADKGRIVKHLRFENAALLTPAAPAALGALATQMALDAALEEITTYLAVIDAKLDRLLKHHQSTTLGALGGVTLAIDEATAIYAETGRVSAITWSKVQANSTALAAMQVEAVTQLAALADGIRDSGRDPHKVAGATDTARKDAPFWLGVLARTISLQDKQYILELARVYDDDLGQVDAHRRGISVARGERVRRIQGSLVAIVDTLRTAAQLPNHAKVTNPFKVHGIVDNANAITREISAFASRAELDAITGNELTDKAWSFAARVLLGDAVAAVTATGADVAEKAKGVGRQLEDARDRVVLEQASRIHERRQAADRQLLAADEPNLEADPDTADSPEFPAGES